MMWMKVFLPVLFICQPLVLPAQSAAIARNDTGDVSGKTLKAKITGMLTISESHMSALVRRGPECRSTSEGHMLEDVRGHPEGRKISDS